MVGNGLGVAVGVVVTLGNGVRVGGRTVTGVAVCDGAVVGGTGVGGVVISPQPTTPNKTINALSAANGRT